VEALYVKLYAFDSMFGRLQPRQMMEAGVTGNVLLSLIDRMKGNVSPLAMRYSQFESTAYSIHGRLALVEGMEESARRALVLFRTSLEVSNGICDDQGIATAKSNIAIAKSKYEGGNDKEGMLRAFQELYELRVAEYGEGHEDTILAGKTYAGDLHTANRGDEAMELLTKILATSKQVLGPHHSTTKEVEYLHKCFNTKINSSDKLL
jgi:hypothetical protein